jgi:hypothetical protein
MRETYTSVEKLWELLYTDVHNVWRFQLWELEWTQQYSRNNSITQRLASAYFGCPSTLSLFTEILEVPASHASRGSRNTCQLLVRQVLGVLMQDLSSADLIWQPKLD